ncbi:MAG: hypothetical protein LPH21_14545, partial [Shewanella sp.]|nr:hypothetical protein [Shewanella sp.]
TIRAKMLLQDMWTAGLGWDDELTEPLINLACALLGELGNLKDIQVPRRLWNKGMIADSMSLHTFLDASESAYGAVVYARCTYEDGTVSTNIVSALTRVSPNIATSIPRLELMGAIVGVRLTSRIAEVLGIKLTKTTFWCDNVNMLWWVRGRSRNFKPFIANRSGEIQTNTEPNQWRYVPSGVNPADKLSRGMHATDLAHCDSWWRGPLFLQESEDAWQVFDTPFGDPEIKHSARGMKSNRLEPEVDQNERCTLLTWTDGKNCPFDPTYYSSWLKLR